MSKQGEVSIVSSSTMRPRVGPEQYRLRFPQHWRAEPVANPEAAMLESQTIEWLNSYGIGSSPEGRTKLRKFECGKYGGYSMPKAPPHAALLATQFISLWLFWDDVEVEDHTTWSIDDVAEALRGDAISTSNAYLRAWNDLGVRLCSSRSSDWQRRFAASMRQWLDNAQLETKMSRAMRSTGVWPSTDALLECRTVSIGMYPTFYLIEFTERFELPDTFHEHAAVQALKRSASRLVGIGNDLCGLAKDIRDHWLNLVRVEAQNSRGGLAEAFERVVTLHNREVLDFDRLALQVPSFGSEVDRLAATWIQLVRYNVFGFALWESEAERYQELTAFDGERALIATAVVHVPELPQ